MHLTLAVKKYHEFFWLRDIRDVNIQECCAKCFIGGRDNRVYFGTLRRASALIDLDVIQHRDAKAYYLCGLSAGYNWWHNTHIAFVPSPGHTIYIDNENIRLTITDAEQIDFMSYRPDPPGVFTNRQRRCRNWIFANFIKDGELQRRLSEMEMQRIIEQAEENIRQALRDYGARTHQTDVLDDVSDRFIENLARDSAYAKKDLRELFSKSPVWDSKLDALVINGTRTHDKDYNLIYALAREIFDPVLDRLNPYDYEESTRMTNILKVIDFFSTPFEDGADLSEYIAAMNAVAPGAYKPTRKLGRVFKAICVALGVSDETAGSTFQRKFAQLADELTSKKIGFKLFVSINPAHFITMSNPKGDQRGNCLTSCHSFNSTEYSYNNGCSGYARDEVTFIVFTVDDPTDAESLNNRKVTRQLFAYRPGSGMLTQSRMYVKSGGVYGGAESATSKLYRDLVQREISMLEDVPNLWQTYKAYGEKSRYIQQGGGFGGYPDWEYEDFDAKVCFRADCDPSTVKPLVVGADGLCVKCGYETSEGVYCDDCKYDHYDYTCDHCGEGCDDVEQVYRHGERIYVCEDCRDRYYTYCDQCETYHHNDDVTEVDGRYYCDDCLDEYCEQCEECGEYHRREDMTRAYDADGHEVWVCNDCLDEHYFYCDKCGNYCHDDTAVSVIDKYGNSVVVCEDCTEGFEECPECGRKVEVRPDGTCPHCGVVIDGEENTEDEKEAAIA